MLEPVKYLKVMERLQTGMPEKPAASEESPGSSCDVQEQSSGEKAQPAAPCALHGWSGATCDPKCDGKELASQIQGRSCAPSRAMRSLEDANTDEVLGEEQKQAEMSTAAQQRDDEADPPAPLATLNLRPGFGIPSLFLSPRKTTDSAAQGTWFSGGGVPATIAPSGPSAWRQLSPRPPPQRLEREPTKAEGKAKGPLKRPAAALKRPAAGKVAAPKVAAAEDAGGNAAPEEEETAEETPAAGERVWVCHPQREPKGSYIQVLRNNKKKHIITISEREHAKHKKIIEALAADVRGGKRKAEDIVKRDVLAEFAE